MPNRDVLPNTSSGMNQWWENGHYTLPRVGWICLDIHSDVHPNTSLLLQCISFILAGGRHLSSNILFNCSSVRKTSFKQLLNWTRLLMSTLPIAGLSALNPPAAPRPTVWISSCNFSLISSLSPKLSLKIPALAIPPIQISSSYDFLGFAITERKTWLSSEHS